MEINDEVFGWSTYGPQGSASPSAIAPKIASLISQIGLDFEQISRLTGVHRETVRYRYKRQMASKGLLVQAVPDYARLGLEKLIAIVRLRPDLEPIAPSIFAAMNGACYLVGYSLVIPSGEYILQLVVPTPLVCDLQRLIEGFAERGEIFSDATVFRFRTARSPPMMTRYFDFERSTWAFDWSARSLPKGVGLPVYETTGVCRYDFLDLLLLSELGVDASRSQVSIAEKAGVKTKTLGWHYCEHLLKKQLIKYYRIGWMHGRFDESLQGVTLPRHQYIPLFMLARDIDESETLEVSSTLNGLPFLWEEAFGNRVYCAFAFVLANGYPEFLNRALGFGARLGSRLGISVLEPSRSCLLALPYRLFDRDRRRWQFERESITRKLQIVYPRITAR